MSEYPDLIPYYRNTIISNRGFGAPQVVQDRVTSDSRVVTPMNQTREQNLRRPAGWGKAPSDSHQVAKPARLQKT